MHITLTGIHLEITDAIRDYVHERINSLGKYAQGDDGAVFAVELSKTTAHHTHGDVFKAEVHVHFKTKDFTVEVVTDDLYKSIDEVKDKLARELTEHKDKQFSLFKRGAHKFKKMLRLQNEG